MPHISTRGYIIKPVVAVAVYRNDVLVMRPGGVVPRQKPVRGEIMELSDGSLKRLAFVANNADVEFRSMITLTYPNEFPVDGKQVKAHLGHFLVSLKRKNGRVIYLWFLEFQKRGAPHFHILLNIGLPEDDRDRALAYTWLSEVWYRIVGSGDDLHRLAGTRWENLRDKEGGRHYVVKYCAKTYQKQVPEGYRQVGRFWGCSRLLTVTPVLIRVADENEIRQSLSEWPYLDHTESFMPRVLYNAARYWQG